MSEKHYLKSKTIWGAIVAALPAFIPLLGSESVATIETIGTSLLSLIGAGLAVYGRIKAKDKLTK